MSEWRNRNYHRKGTMGETREKASSANGCERWERKSTQRTNSVWPKLSPQGDTNQQTGKGAKPTNRALAPLGRRFPWMLLLFCLLEAMPLRSEAHNPRPTAGDFVLPMPNGEEMVFRRVFLDKGADLFAIRIFQVGEEKGVLGEESVKVGLGGEFLEKNSHGALDWVYYLGKYEVTEGQYLAIMGPGSRSPSQKPAAGHSWFEVQEFLHRYNLWLFENAASALPKNDGVTGFLRLPTEVEWEFAARGGSTAPKELFKKKHPYAGALERFEWFSGPRSSGNKLKRAGLRKPNPLGLHDMLGNVQEMTGSLYQVEYYQGSVGGFVARGGHYLSPRSEIRVARRVEIPFYQEGRPSKDKTMGFRVMVASTIHTSPQRR